MARTSSHHDVTIINKSSIYPEEGYMYSTHEDIMCMIDGKLVTIPRGFKTDLASVPRWYWPIISPRYTSFITPSILHDYLYKCECDVSRKFADQVLYDTLLSEGVSKYTATKFYLGVRLFGWKFYKDKSCNSAVEDVNEDEVCK